MANNNLNFRVVDNEKEYKLLTSWDAPVYNGEGAFIGMSKVEWNRRNLKLNGYCGLSSGPFQECVAKTIHMPFYEEATVCIIWCLFLGTILYTPIFLVWKLFTDTTTFYWMSFSIFALQLVLPTKFRPNLCKGYLAKLMLKYFSHRGIWKEQLPIDRPSIIVAPPHGLFPFGSLLAVLSVPRITGMYLRGLAADALLRIPIIGTRMRALGLTSASRDNARKMLRDGWTLGVSSGGIAEIFETTQGGKEDERIETIILKSRGGLAKLALETGSYLVPS